MGQLQKCHMYNRNTRWSRNRRNIWSNNDWEFYKINDRHQTTDPRSSENTQKDKYLKIYTYNIYGLRVLDCWTTGVDISWRGTLTPERIKHSRPKVRTHTLWGSASHFPPSSPPAPLSYKKELGTLYAFLTRTLPDFEKASIAKDQMNWVWTSEMSP